MTKESRIKTHSFDIKEAEELGSIEKAIILQHLRSLLNEAKKHSENAKDGFVWVSCPAISFSQEFPYMHPRSIGRWLFQMTEAGVIRSTKLYSHQGSKFDHTNWYTIPSEYRLDKVSKQCQ